MRDTALPLRPRTAGQSHHLADPVYRVQSRIYRLTAFRLAVSADEPGDGSQCPGNHPRWPQFRMVRGDLSHPTYGTLSPSLYLWPPGARDGADALWSVAARVFPGR